MFFNETVTVSSRGEDRQLTPVYSGIPAIVYRGKRRQSNGTDLAENSVREYLTVCLQGDKTDVKAGHIITFTDQFGKEVKLLAGNPFIVRPAYFPKLVQIECDFV